MKKTLTLEDVILETMPFSKQLVMWCKTHPKFFAALKNIYAGKFISLGAIVTSYSRSQPKDEVIGIYTYDYQRKNPIFKQDFIVNKDGLNQKFILFTRAQSSKYVKDINDFFATYGRGSYYTNSHHLSLSELPDEIKQRGEDAIKLAKKIKNTDLKKIPLEHIELIYKQIKNIKKDKWLVKRKLTK